MGGVLGGGSKPDTSAMQAQIEQQRKETERLRAQAEQEKRDLSEEMSAKRKARATRGGSRLLLAEERLTPETGLPMDEEKLGA
jgi:hypothetical protein